jgi:hypothetical protein
MGTPVIEAIVVAFVAATLASMADSYIKNGIAKIKRRRKLRKRPRETGASS